MSELEDELIDNSIDAHSTADQFHLGVGRVAEMELLLIKACERFTSNAASDLFSVSALLEVGSN